MNNLKENCLQRAQKKSREVLHQIVTKMNQKNICKIPQNPIRRVMKNTILRRHNRKTFLQLSS